jgi:hypothetical protein
MTMRQRSKEEMARLVEAMRAAGIAAEIPVAAVGIDEAEMICEEDGMVVERLEKGRENGMTDCGKVGYSSESKARKTIRRRQGAGAGRLRPYFCPRCHRWHISSMRKEPHR